MNQKYSFAFMEFPIYRKYFNGMSFYKIISEIEFEEKQLVGSKVHKHQVIANQFPEKLRIQDMISCKDKIWETMNESDYLKLD